MIKIVETKGEAVLRPDHADILKSVKEEGMAARNHVRSFPRKAHLFEMPTYSLQGGSDDEDWGQVKRTANEAEKSPRVHED